MKAQVVVEGENKKPEYKRQSWICPCGVVMIMRDHTAFGYDVKCPRCGNEAGILEAANE